METESKCSLITGLNFAKSLNCCSDTLSNFSPNLADLAVYYWKRSSVSPHLFNHVPTLSMLEMLSDVQGCFHDPECKSLVYTML
jgi:hypothetical protein